MVSLKPSQPNQLLSTSVASVWEESEVSAYPRTGKPATDEALSNVIFQIKTQKKRNVIGVQRGKSIGIYDQQGIPALLCTVPNICYGTRDYIGWNSSRCKPNPRLLSFDFNCNALSDLVTVDENQIVQFLDLSAEKVVLQTKGQDLKSTRSHFQEMDLNASGGVAYAAGHPQVIYHWTNSQISLHDLRVSPRVTQRTELLNLRSSLSSFSWSDQQIFNTNCGKSLNEYISCLKPSENVIHYYVGTTNRAFLMDMRVPKNPVVKFSHGMKGPAAYLDVLNDENYEILVGGCQRTSEIFCANFDTTHLSCVDRTECKARNPILQSYPRHLLSSRNFFDFAEEGGFGFNYEADHKRVKGHFDAWTTGLCIMKPTSNFKWNPSGPHPFLLFSGNSFGDIFCQELIIRNKKQEWEQKPSESSQRRGGTDTNDPRLTSVIRQWKSAMESTELQEFHRRSLNPFRSVDCDLLIESSAHSLKHSRKIRTKRFDPFTPSTLTYSRVRDGLPCLDEQIAKLRHINSQRVQKFLNVWTDTDGDNDYEALPRNPGNTVPEPTDSRTLHETQVDIPEEEENRADFVQLKEEINEEFYMEMVDTDVEIDDDENSTPFQDCLTRDYGMEDLINQQSDLPTIDESSVYFVKPEPEV